MTEELRTPTALEDFREDFVTAAIQSAWMSGPDARNHFDQKIAQIRSEAAEEALRDAADGLLETGMVWPVESVAGVIGATKELRNRADRIQQEQQETPDAWV